MIRPETSEVETTSEVSFIKKGPGPLEGLVPISVDQISFIFC